MRRLSIRHIALSLFAIAGLMSSAHAQVMLDITTVGADAACDYRTDELPNALQSAIDGLPVTPEAGIIKVIQLANTGNFDISTPIVVSDRDVQIIGGFSDCADTTPSGTTVIDAQSLYNGPVMRVFANSRQPSVLLRGLSLTGGNNDNFTGGGGLDINGGDVRLLASAINGNHAAQGGGIFIRGQYFAGRLEMDDHAVVSNNTADSFGGGIYCTGELEGASLLLNSSSQVVSNAADSSGGGIAVVSGCEAIVNSGGSGIAATLNNVTYNTAANDGGGIYVESSAGHVSRFRIGDGLLDSDPLPTIRYNQAGSFGGGIYLSGNSEVTINSALIGSNVAAAGGGIFASGQLLIARATDHCDGSSECIRFISNRAESYGSGSALFASGSNASVSVDGARFFDNESVLSSEDSTVYGSTVLSYEGAVAIQNSVFSGNSALSVFNARYAGGVIRLFADTIADNTLVTAVIDIAPGGSTQLGHNIIQAEGGIPVLNRESGNTNVALDCNLLHEEASVAAEIDAASHTLTGKNPGFVDAVGNNYHIVESLAFAAVDACAAPILTFDGSERDYERNQRPVDANIPDLAGSYDVGAYELNYDLFGDGFED